MKERVYEIIPISMLNYSKSDLENILNTYMQFLKLIDVKYKIIIRNFKFDKNEYIKKYLRKDILDGEIYRKYIDSIRLKINNENIYTIKIYICFICNEFQDKIIEDVINKLNSIEIKVVKLDKSEIKELLYKAINKL